MTCEPGRMDILMFVNSKIPGLKIKKDFSEPLKKSAEPGDVIILRNDRFLREPTYHAGVCCADGEVIHLSDSSGGVMKAKPGNVCRQHFNGFTQGKQYKILQKEDPLPASFHTKVKQAMNSDECHDKSKHNCIDFSLRLIEFNSSFVELQDSSSSVTPVDLKGASSDPKDPSTTKETKGCPEEKIPLVSPPPNVGESPQIPLASPPPNVGKPPQIPVESPPPNVGKPPQIPLASPPPNVGKPPQIPVESPPPNVGKPPQIPLASPPPNVGKPPQIPVESPPPNVGKPPQIPLASPPPNVGKPPQIPVESPPPNVGKPPQIPVESPPPNVGKPPQTE